MSLNDWKFYVDQSGLRQLSLTSNNSNVELYDSCSEYTDQEFNCSESNSKVQIVTYTQQHQLKMRCKS